MYRLSKKFALSSLTYLVVLTMVLGNLTSAIPVAGQSQIYTLEPLVADGQFVFGPNVADFNTASYLQKQASALDKYAADIECLAGIASINPQILLTLVELYSAGVTTQVDDYTLNRAFGGSEENFSSQLESLAQILTRNFYWYLDEYQPTAPDNGVLTLTFQDGSTAHISTEGLNAATYAVVATLAELSALEQWRETIFSTSTRSFSTTFRSLFPQVKLLDKSNRIVPWQSPPADLLQFPFPQGETWNFNGPHGWSGYDTPYSSIDFARGWPACGGNYDGHDVVAAASGDLYLPNSGARCWVRVNHSGGWTTSYYHLTDLRQSSGSVDRNEHIADIGCETCVGGSASAAHVHFSLLYNGRYISLDGVELSGWEIHTGSSPYNFGYLERGGERKYPYSLVENDYGGGTAPDDDVPPTVQLTETPPASGYLTVASFRWTGDDDQTSRSLLAYRYSLDGGNWSDWHTNRTYKGYSDLSVGEHTFRLKARDAAGNESTEATYTFTINASPLPPTDTRLQMACIKDDGLELMKCQLNGIDVENCRFFGLTARIPPGIAVYGNRTWVAVAQESRDRRVRLFSLDSNDQTISDENLGERTSKDITMLEHDGRLYIVMRGENTFSDKIIARSRDENGWVDSWHELCNWRETGKAPGVTSYEGRLYVSFPDEDSHVLYVYNTDDHGSCSGGKTTSDNVTTDSTNALATYRGQIYLAVRTDTDARELRMYRRNSSGNWQFIRGLGSIPDAPNMVVHNDLLYVFYTDDDNGCVVKFFIWDGENWYGTFSTNSPSNRRCDTRPAFAPVAPTPPLTVIGMEATQGIQCFNWTTEDPNCANNSVPLIENKQTIVRVYAASNTGETQRIYGKLYADDGTASVEIDAENAPVITVEDPERNYNDERDRGSDNRALRFSLPQWLWQDTVKIYVQVYTDTTGTRVRYPASGEMNLTFHDVAPMTIGYVSIPYGGAEPAAARIAHAQDYLQTLYPVNEVEYFPVPVGQEYTGLHERELVIQYLKLLYNVYDVTGWPDPHGRPQQLFGWMPDATWGLDGSSDPPWENGEGYVAYGSDTPSAYQNIFPQQIAYNLGRRVPTCDGADPQWPHIDYAIHDVGWDFQSNTLVADSVDDVTVGNHCGADIAAEKWVAGYTFQKLYEALTGGSAMRQAIQPHETIAAGEPVLLVSGFVYTDTTAELATAYQLTTTQPVDQRTGTDYCLELKDDYETTLSSSCFDLSLIDPEWNVPATAPFVRLLPYAAAATRLVLKYGDSELAERMISARPPTVTLQANYNLQALHDTVNLTWTAQDPDGDALSYVISYSADGGANWYHLAVDITETHLAIDTNILPGGDSALFRVIASDGVHTVSDTSDNYIVIPTHEPQVNILYPEADMAWAPGQPLILRGMGYDLEDGAVADEALVWTTELSGTLGTGSKLEIPGLVTGTHPITLTATDNDGNVGVASIDVHVGYDLLDVVAVSLPTVHADAGDSVVLNLHTTDAAGIAQGEFLVSFADTLWLEDVFGSPLTQDFTIFQEFVDEHTVKITLWGSAELPAGAADLAWLAFSVESDITMDSALPVSVLDAQLLDLNWRDFERDLHRLIQPQDGAILPLAEAPPQAGFISTAPDLIGDTTVFTNTTTGAGELSYWWDFGDGAGSMAVNPTHTYTQTGIYTVTLTASNLGGSDIYTAIVSIEAPPTPEIYTITPNTAVANAGNLPVAISGAHLRVPLTVSIGGVNLLTPTVVNSTTLHAVVPVANLSEGSHDLVVTSTIYEVGLTAAFTVTPPVAETQFRAMVYLACDNNLESDCRILFNRLELAMVDNPDLRLVVLWDGRGDGDSAYYLVQPDVHLLTWAEYTDGVNRLPVNEVDTAYAGTLAEFAVWAQSQYPGHYTLLSLVGHGGGWAPDLHPGQKRCYDWGIGGMMWDEHPRDTMGTRWLAEALNWVTLGDTLDVVYLDACLMGAVEVAAELAPYAHHLVMHENLTWATYPYHEYLRAVDGTVTPRALAQHIATIHRDYWPAIEHPGQVGVINTAALADVTVKLDTLAHVLSNTLPTARPAISQAVMSAAHVAQNDDWRIDAADSYVDLLDLSNHLILQDIDAEVGAAARALVDALSTAVVVNYTRSGAPWPDPTAPRWNLDNLYGLSVYFPLIDEWKRPHYHPDSLPHFAGETRWDDFIQAWYAGQEAPEPPDEPCDDCPNVPMRISLSANPPDAAQVEDTIYVPIYLHAVDAADDVRGVQFDLVVSDTNILEPASEVALPGTMFPDGSLNQSAPLENGWSFIINTPPGWTEPLSGTGTVVELPFHVNNAGCVTVHLTETEIANSDSAPLAHRVIPGWLCTGETGGLQGTVYLQKRASGHYTDTQVLIENVQESYTACTDAHGNFTTTVHSGVYTATFRQWLYHYAERPELTVGSGTMELPENIGLWAGDMNQDDDINEKDWFICAAASIPVDDPAFDLNDDGETNVQDCTIITDNTGRSEDMAHVNPPADTLQVSHQESPRAEDIRISESGQLTVTAPRAGEIILRAINVNEILQSVGARLRLAEGTTVDDVAGMGHFIGGFLNWHQDGTLLYIVAVPLVPFVAPCSVDVARIRVTIPEGGEDPIIESGNTLSAPAIPALTAGGLIGLIGAVSAGLWFARRRFEDQSSERRW